MGKALSKKLCKLTGKKYLKENLDEYRTIIKKAKYVCLKCGRVSKFKKNLCEPEKI
jgi:hypothetical protein